MRILLPSVLTGLVIASLAIVAACSDDDHDHTEAAASCNEIVEACHPLDQGSGPIHECHEQAEEEGKTEAACAAIKASCLATCTPADAATKE